MILADERPSFSNFEKRKKKKRWICVSMRVLAEAHVTLLLRKSDPRVESGPVPASATQDEGGRRREGKRKRSLKVIFWKSGRGS